MAVVAPAPTDYSSDWYGLSSGETSAEWPEFVDCSLDMRRTHDSQLTDRRWANYEGLAAGKGSNGRNCIFSDPAWRQQFLDVRHPFCYLITCSWQLLS